VLAAGIAVVWLGLFATRRMLERAASGGSAGVREARAAAGAQLSRDRVTAPHSRVATGRLEA
jgi:hypothetical protein